MSLMENAASAKKTQPTIPALIGEIETEPLAVVWIYRNEKIHLSLKMNPNSFRGGCLHFELFVLRLSPVSCGSMPIINGACQQYMSSAGNSPIHCFFLTSLIYCSWELFASCVNGRHGEGVLY